MGDRFACAKKRKKKDRLARERGENGGDGKAWAGKRWREKVGLTHFEVAHQAASGCCRHGDVPSRANGGR